MVFSVKYEVSEEDRRKVIDGTYVVDSDDETFRGLAEELAAIYEDATKDAVDFSKVFLVEKRPGETRKKEVTGASLDASLTYDLASDEIWVVVKRSRGRASFELDRSEQKGNAGAVFSVKYAVSKEDRLKVLSGEYKVTSDDETFKGLADALVAEYQKATSSERVEFSKFFLIKKQSGDADKMYEVSDGALLGSLTYDLMSDQVWVVVKSCT